MSLIVRKTLTVNTANRDAAIERLAEFAQHFHRQSRTRSRARLASCPMEEAGEGLVMLSLDVEFNPEAGPDTGADEADEPWLEAWLAETEAIAIAHRTEVLSQVDLPRRAATRRRGHS